MNTRKCKLHYAKLGKENEDVKEIVFTSSRNRFNYIADKTIGNITVNSPKIKVFILAIEKDMITGKYCPEYDTIYVFHNFNCIKDIQNKSMSMWKNIFLFEYESYEEAYKAALDMREPINLCYSEIIQVDNIGADVIVPTSNPQLR